MAAAASSVHQLVRRLEADIAAGATAAGTLLGTEQELCLQYGVSATTFRQAARVLEASGIAAMRPGNRGGLIAAGPSVDGAARTAAAYLQFTGAQVDDVMALSEGLFPLLIRLATDRVTVAAVQDLRALLKAINQTDELYEQGLRRTQLFEAVARIAGNPVLQLCQQMSMHFLVDVVPFELMKTGKPSVWVEPAEIVETIIGGDQARGHRLIRDYTQMHAEIFANAEKGTLQSAEALEAGSSRTRSAKMARQLLGDIRRMNWPVGARLGDEPELMARYGVSRATYRQAIRTLEEYFAVETRRGLQGGIFVAEPNPRRIVSLATATLRRCGATADDSRAVGALVLLAAFQAAQRRDPQGLEEALTGAVAAARDDELAGVAQAYRALADIAGNPVVTFVMGLIAAFDAELEVDTRPATNGGAAATLAVIAAALKAGDESLARRAWIDLGAMAAFPSRV